MPEECVNFAPAMQRTGWHVPSNEATGKLIDENHQPLPYANIVLLSLPDSAFVAGVVSGDDGTFLLNATCEGKLIRISSIGYTTIYKECTGQDLGILQLQPDAQMLGEVVVKADLPKVRIKGDAQVTTVQGSILEQAGTGNDLLNKLPGVSADEGGERLRQRHGGNLHQRAQDARCQ